MAVFPTKAMDLESYRQSESERARTADLLRLLPTHRSTVLDVGARDGHFSRLLAQRFDGVTALDLVKPDLDLERVTPVAGDATALPFPDRSFDVVFCAEVLEHIPSLEQACRELGRVARHEVLVGVPFEQDTRLGRVTCLSCGRISPPWGHVNTFTQAKLERLFTGLRPLEISFVGAVTEATNTLSTWLMDRAGNPWGVYDQEEPCVHCGARLVPPNTRSIGSKVLSKLAALVQSAQEPFNRSHANWIHVLFQRH
jgi:ubiquinone/menaquinone biosynthesis C-methylase UbiE